MHLFFGDDSIQERPSRQGVGRLLGLGGYLVESRAIPDLAAELEAASTAVGLGPEDPFKWSPDRGLAFREVERSAFFERILTAAHRHCVEVVVVMADTTFRPAVRDASRVVDLTTMLLERVDMAVQRVGSRGIVILDRPGGSLSQQDKTMLDNSDLLARGSDYWTRQCVDLVATTPASRSRLLQLADVITGCTVAYVAGSGRQAGDTFPYIRPMLRSSEEIVGGIGVKIHPKGRYVNLYHWLLGDCSGKIDGVRVTLPTASAPYPESEERFR